MRICADPIQMRGKGDAVRTLRAALQNNMDRIESLVLSVNGAWQGDSERAYASKILFIKREFSGILSFLEDYAALLASFADQYDEFDSGLAAKISLT